MLSDPACAQFVLYALPVNQKIQIMHLLSSYSLGNVNLRLISNSLFQNAAYFKQLDLKSTPQHIYLPTDQWLLKRFWEVNLMACK